MRSNLLIIDDDERLLDLLSRYLGQNGFHVSCASTPAEGLALLRREQPDLLVLDVMMPGKNGLDLCKEIRQQSSPLHRLPILMLTARGDVNDRVLGLELGADDYLAKPFEARELVARIQSILRRAAPPVPVTQTFRRGRLEIDLGSRSAKLGGTPLDLTTSEFETLVLFASQPGKVFSRDQMMAHLRGVDWLTYQRSADVLISRLRQKLKDDPKRPTFFKTVWGTGYVFLATKSDPEG